MSSFEESLEPSIERWVRARDLPVADLLALPGDVSMRRYFRLQVRNGPTRIVAYYPPTIRNQCERFAKTTDLLTTAGVRVPRILAVDAAEGLMLLEDLGPLTLYDLRHQSWTSLGPTLTSAVAIWQKIRKLERAAVSDLNPPLDAERLRREFGTTLEQLLLPLGMLEGDTKRALTAAVGELCERLQTDELQPCHRDFMARNLVPTEDGLVVIDHQDLRLGPVTYDLASLLNDSLYPPREIEREALHEAKLSAVQIVDYHRSVVQRTLKAAGTFATFARRGIGRHIPLIAPTLGRALHAMRKVPELRELVPTLAVRWQPKLEAADGFEDLLKSPGGRK